MQSGRLEVHEKLVLLEDPELVIVRLLPISEKT